MKYQEKAELERIDNSVSLLNKEYDELRNKEIGIQFRLEDIRQERRVLKIRHGELNLAIIKRENTRN